MAEQRSRITLELASRSFNNRSSSWAVIGIILSFKRGRVRQNHPRESAVGPFNAALIKKWPDLFVSFAGADSFNALQVIGAFEWARLDDAFGDGWANSRNVFELSLRRGVDVEFGWSRETRRGGFLGRQWRSRHLGGGGRRCFHRRLPGGVKKFVEWINSFFAFRLLRSSCYPFLVSSPTTNLFPFRLVRELDQIFPFGRG